MQKGKSLHPENVTYLAYQSKAFIKINSKSNQHSKFLISKWKSAKLTGKAYGKIKGKRDN
jgi:hypothetical protein